MGGQGFRPLLEASKDSALSALSIRALPFWVRDQPAPPRGPGATSAKPSATKLDTAPPTMLIGTAQATMQARRWST